MTSMEVNSTDSLNLVACVCLLATVPGYFNFQPQWSIPPLVLDSVWLDLELWQNGK